MPEKMYRDAFKKYPFAESLVFLTSGLTLSFVTLTSTQVAAQINLIDYITDESHDSLFVISYDKFITGRFYFSQKYTRFDIIDDFIGGELLFRPNTSLNMGVGATYGKFTLNLAYGFSFLNPEAGRGDTRWLDLQTRVYARRYIVDVYAQFYKGLFLRNTASAIENPGLLEGPYYLRDDIYLQQLGLAAAYIFNSERFSYRASFVQNEWQHRSAGSFLLGLEVYSGMARGDSSLIPSSTNPEGIFDGRDIRTINFFEIGPSAGYAHTFVYRKHWFFTAHLSSNPAVGWISEYDEGSLNRRVALYPNLMTRAVVGYNSRQWFFGVSHINNSLRIASSYEGRRYNMDTGNVRLNVAKRFVPRLQTKRYLRILDSLN